MMLINVKNSILFYLIHFYFSFSFHCSPGRIGLGAKVHFRAGF
jgi:hypothetical protein